MPLRTGGNFCLYQNMKIFSLKFFLWSCLYWNVTLKWFWVLTVLIFPKWKSRIFVLRSAVWIVENLITKEEGNLKCITQTKAYMSSVNPFAVKGIRITLWKFLLHLQMRIWDMDTTRHWCISIYKNYHKVYTHSFLREQSWWEPLASLLTILKEHFESWNEDF